VKLPEKNKKIWKFALKNKFFVKLPQKIEIIWKV